MCKIGDIILVDEYIGDDFKVIGQHSFIVMSNNKDMIEGFYFDMIGTVMSKFESEKHRARKLSHEENFEIRAIDTVIINGNSKDGYTKADQLFFFNKKTIKYKYLGKMDEKVFKELNERIKMLDKKGKVKHNTENIKEKVEV